MQPRPILGNYFRCNLNKYFNVKKTGRRIKFDTQCIRIYHLCSLHSVNVISFYVALSMFERKNLVAFCFGGTKVHGKYNRKVVHVNNTTLLS